MYTKIDKLNNTHTQYFKYSQVNSISYDSEEYLRNDQYFQNKLTTLWKSLMNSYSKVPAFGSSMSKEPSHYNSMYLNNREIVIRALKNNKSSIENLTNQLLFDIGYNMSLFENPIPIEDAIKIQDYVNYNDGIDSGSCSGSSSYKEFVSNQKKHLIRFFAILEHFFFFLNKKYYSQTSFSNYLIESVFFNEKPLLRSIVQFYQIHYKYLNYNLLFLTIFNSKKLDWFLKVSDIGELLYLLDLLFGSISIPSKIELIKLIHQNKPTTHNQSLLIGCFFLNCGWASFDLKEFYSNGLPLDDNLFHDIKNNQSQQKSTSNSNSTTSITSTSTSTSTTSSNNDNINNSDINKSPILNSIYSKILVNNPDEASYLYINQFNLQLDNLKDSGIGSGSNGNSNINNQLIESNITSNTNIIKKEFNLSNLLLLKIFNYLISSIYNQPRDICKEKRSYYSLVSKSILNIALSSKNFFNLIRKSLSYIEWDKKSINLIHNQYLPSSVNNSNNNSSNSNNSNDSDNNNNNGDDNNSNKCLIQKYPSFQSYNKIIKTINYKDINQIKEMCLAVNTLYIDTLVQMISKNGDEQFGGIAFNKDWFETICISFSTYFKYQSFPNVKSLILKGRSIKRYDYKLNGNFLKFIQYFIVSGGSELVHFEMDGKVVYDSVEVFKIVLLVLKYHKSTLSSITLRIKHKKRNWVRAIIKLIAKKYPSIQLSIYRNDVLQSNEFEYGSNSDFDVYDLVEESDDQSFHSDVGFDSNSENYFNNQGVVSYGSDSEQDISDSEQESDEDNDHYNSASSFSINITPRFKDDFGQYSDCEDYQEYIQDYADDENDFFVVNDKMVHNNYENQDSSDDQDDSDNNNNNNSYRIIIQ